MASIFALGLMALALARTTSAYPPPFFGNQVGNGGKVVVCRDANHGIVGAQLLDFYEGDLVYGLRPTFGEGNYIAKAREAAGRLAPHDEERARRYQTQIDAFEANAKKIRGAILETPDNETMISPPEGCSYEQAITQLAPSFPGDRLYNISEPLWDHLDEDDRAGLVLHEIIYTEAIRRGHKTAAAVRYFNANISSDNVRLLDARQYAEVLRTTRLASIPWEDPLGKTWVFAASFDLEWAKAGKLCSWLFPGSVLPSLDEMNIPADALSKSPLAEIIQATDIPETWNSDRRDADGEMAVSIWEKAHLTYGYRGRSEFANVLCEIKPGKDGLYEE